MASENNNYIVTGTSGSGKTVLVEELHARGYRVFDEAQRAVLTEQLAIDGPALPAKDPKSFIEALLERCILGLEEAASTNAISFFDRGLPDVAAYAIRFGVDPADCYRWKEFKQYNQHAFILPPWKDIFETDALRGKTFEEYEDFHQLITSCYEQAGFNLIEVPMCSIRERANFILKTIGKISP